MNPHHRCLAQGLTDGGYDRNVRTATARPLIPEAEDPGHYYRVWDSSDDPARHGTKIRFGKFRAGAPTSLG